MATAFGKMDITEAARGGTQEELKKKRATMMAGIDAFNAANKVPDFATELGGATVTNPTAVTTAPQANQQAAAPPAGYKPGDVMNQISKLNESPKETPAQGTTAPAAPTGPSKPSGINYSLDAAGNVVGNAPQPNAGNPHDETFKNVISRIESLSGNLVPGDPFDNYEKNYGTLNQIKNLKSVAELVKPLTTEGQGIPVAQIRGQWQGVLDPSQVAENQAKTKLANAQTEAIMPKPDQKAMDVMGKLHQERAKWIGQNITPGMTPAEIAAANKTADEIFHAPMVHEAAPTKEGHIVRTYLDKSQKKFDKKGKLIGIKYGVPGTQEEE